MSNERKIFLILTEGERASLMYAMGMATGVLYDGQKPMTELEKHWFRQWLALANKIADVKGTNQDG